MAREGRGTCRAFYCRADGELFDTKEVARVVALADDCDVRVGCVNCAVCDPPVLWIRVGLAVFCREVAPAECVSRCRVLLLRADIDIKGSRVLFATDKTLCDVDEKIAGARVQVASVWWCGEQLGEKVLVAKVCGNVGRTSNVGALD